QMLGQLPNNSSVPMSQQAAQSNLDQPLQMVSASDIEAAYGTQLSGYESKVIDVEGFVMAALSNCFQTANSQVQNELTRSNTSLGESKFKMQEADKQLVAQGATTLNNMNGLYRQTMQSMV